MAARTKTQYPLENQSKTKDSIIDNVRVIAEITRKNIEQSYSIDNIQGAEVYYSNRYGWTLRKTLD